MVMNAGKNNLFNRWIVVVASVCLLVVVFKFFFSSIRSLYSEKDLFYIRVRIDHNVPSVRLSSTKKCSISDGDKRLTANAVRLKDSVISSINGKLAIDKMPVAMDSAQLVYKGHSRDNLFVLNGKKYRGDIVIRHVKGVLDVINVVEIEEYLKGVVPREVSHLWPFEALKAQAIASRSYAVNQAIKRKKLGHDLRDDTFSQVYGGQGAERWRTNKAVEATRGKVVMYAGKVLPAYFHSCCGGHTEDMAILWKKSLPPLEGVKCLWCKWSPYYRWQVRMSDKKLKEKLKTAGYENRRVDDIKSGLRDRSGRLEYVSVRSGNNWFDIKAYDFLRAVGSRSIKSTKMRIEKYPFFYRFTGYGWGHGVGMCQWGAFGLALRWKNAETILKTYYPGVEIKNLREIIS